MALPLSPEKEEFGPQIDADERGSMIGNTIAAHVKQLRESSEYPTSKPDSMDTLDRIME
jgi:hypothetical protein